MDPYRHGVVEPTVRDVHRRFAQYVDLDDLLQEAAVWWYGEGQPYLPTWLAEDEKHVRLRRSIWRYVARYAQAEKAAKTGYHPDDQYRYSPAQVIDVLPVALDPVGIPGGQSVHDGGPVAHGNLAEGGDQLALLADVRRALIVLDGADVEYLDLVDHLHGDYDRVATYLGIQADSARRRHTRIAERMSRWLNNDQEIAA